jgi:hypothetical protein
MYLRLSAAPAARGPLPLPCSMHGVYRAPAMAAAAPLPGTLRGGLLLSPPRSGVRATALLLLFIWAHFQLLVDEKIIVDEKYV